MEFSEKSLDVVNDLIKFNNDRAAGFEKAGTELQDNENDLLAVFNKLTGESREYVNELTRAAQQYGSEAVEGTSTAGDLHRAWIDIKSTFTGGGRKAILDECERGEDAAKAAYRDALAPENELSYEITQLLQKQQRGIIEGHNLIKTLRDRAGNNNPESTGADKNMYNNEEIAAEPSYEGAAGEYGRQNEDTPEPESIEQEQEWDEAQEIETGNNKLMKFFINELKDLLWAEKELVDVLPDMQEAATSQELKGAFEQHLAETETHVTRLEQVFGILGLEPETRKCDAMAGITDEGDEIISATEEGTAQRDVGLIFAGQKAEHYEIASYGGMIALANTLGYKDVAELLVMTLDEEKTADATLTGIAESQANYAATTEQAED